MFVRSIATVLIIAQAFNPDSSPRRPTDSHVTSEVAQAGVEGGAYMGGFEVVHLEVGSRQAVRDRDIHGARQRNQDVAGINRDRNARSGLRID